MEAFFRTLGIPESEGGRSPYHVNFVFTEKAKAVAKSTEAPALTTAAEEEAKTKAAEPTAELDLPRRLFKSPLWLAMLLTFLGLTLLFLFGSAVHWCLMRQSEESVSAAAGSYSPPIGSYSKVGATIQFGSTWVS